MAAERTGTATRGGSVFRKAIAGWLIAGATVAIGACGGGGGGGPSGNNLTVCSSLPLVGASTSQTKSLVNGVQLALDEPGGKVGQFSINRVSLDDATAQRG